MDKGSELRRHVRFSANLAIRIVMVRGKKQETQPGRMVDISEGGMCFIGHRYLPPGSELRIEFGECRLHAQVRHCQLREYGTHTQFVIGVQIANVEAGEDSWAALLKSVV